MKNFLSEQTFPPKLPSVRITLKFVAKKTSIIKVIQNFMAIRLYFNHFSEKTCWKKLFHFQFGLLFFDICCLFWYGRRSSPRRQLVTSMSTKKESKLKIEYLFSASPFWVSIIIKSDHYNPKNTSKLSPSLAKILKVILTNIPRQWKYCNDIIEQLDWRIPQPYHWPKLWMAIHLGLAMPKKLLFLKKKCHIYQ